MISTKLEEYLENSRVVYTREVYMTVELTEQERTLLLELIENAEQVAIQGMDHADSRDFKDLLRRRLELLGSAKGKLQNRDFRVV